MNVDQLTIGELKSLMAFVGTKSAEPMLELEIGKNYFIRTVTMYYLGKVVSKTTTSIVLDEASWIADTGRFYDFLKNGKANEIEPFIKPVVLPVGSFIDATEWTHQLPREQK